MKKVVIGTATLYHGDCLEILPAIKPVRLAAFDAPYLLTSGGDMFQSMGGKFSKQEYNNDGAIVPCDISWSDFMPSIWRAIQDGGELYMMANNRHLTVADSVAQHQGFTYHNHLIWRKTGFAGTRNRWYMKNCEFTLYYSKGKSKKINNCGSNQIFECPIPKNGFHPTEKPVVLFQNYIENSSQIGDVVLDPFMGSGTTGVAAIRSGREFIGIEKDEKHFNTAVQRISREMAPEGLPGVSEISEGA